MGLVKTRRRLAEDMHRRGEASEGTLPKATRRGRKRVRSPHRVARPESAPCQAVRKCCQWESVASSNVANFQLGIERAHLRNSPPSLLMFGNNYLKQLAFGARANSPAPILPVLKLSRL